MNPEGKRILIRAAAIADGTGLYSRPGAILAEVDTPPAERRGGSSIRIIATGSPQSIGRASNSRTLDLPDSLVIPPLANVHSHLDLTHIGRQMFDSQGGFVGWIEQIRSRRASNESDIRESVKRGADLAIAGGTALIGDIAGGRSLVPLQTLRQFTNRLRGVSFLEVFGIGNRRAQGLDFLREIGHQFKDEGEEAIRLGVQPHAPYSCDREVYHAAAGLKLPLATHLAETPEELEFIAAATGPLATMLESFGLWDSSIHPRGCHPVEYLSSVLSETSAILAHVNYASDAQIQALSRLPVSIAYCPRASNYFGHRNHRYRDMINAGINVALGSDSIVCLPQTLSKDPGDDRISVLDEMRFLHQRDGLDPGTLLRMGTINGARALGVDQALVTLAPGPIAGLLAVPIDVECDDLRRSALQRNDLPRWIL
jgi:cytosine/adenosine deaminase-related metal-dependent hydrolase